MHTELWKTVVLTHKNKTILNVWKILQILMNTKIIEISILQVYNFKMHNRYEYSF